MNKKGYIFSYDEISQTGVVYQINDWNDREVVVAKLKFKIQGQRDQEFKNRVQEKLDVHFQKDKNDEAINITYRS